LALIRKSRPLLSLETSPAPEKEAFGLDSAFGSSRHPMVLKEENFDLLVVRA